MSGRSSRSTKKAATDTKLSVNVQPKAKKPRGARRPQKAATTNAVTVVNTGLVTVVTNVVSGFISRNRKPSKQTRARFVAHVEVLRQLLAKRNPTWDAKTAAQAARDQAIAEFFELGSHPFGYQKYVTYTFNSTTGDVRMAGALFTVQDPDHRILFRDLKAQAENRFIDNRRAVCFNIGAGERPRDKLDKIIEEATRCRGLSGDSALHKKFQRKQAHEAHLKSGDKSGDNKK